MGMLHMMFRSMGIIFLLIFAISPVFALTVNVHKIEGSVAFPVERCFIGRIHVCSEQPTEVFFDIEGKENKDWLVIVPTGRIPLNNCADIVFTIEPAWPNPRDFEGTVIIMSSTEKITIPISVKVEDPKYLLTNEVEIEVLDTNGIPVEGAQVILSSPYGPEAREIVTGMDGKAYEKFLKEFYVEIRKEGYKPYFGYVSGSKVKAILEPKEETKFLYEKIAEYDTGFSVWWIKASQDGKYIVTSPGSHPGSAEPVKSAYIMFFDSSGKLLWRYEIDTSSYENTDYCWGLDITQDGKYVAMGCFNGYVYLFDRDGTLLKKYYAGGNVREVKFTEDGRYLIFGPTDRGAEYFGIFEVPSLREKCQGYIGDWPRKIAVHNDSIAVSASNGMLALFDLNCNRKWIGSNGGLVPFVGGFNDKGDKIVTAGKGMKVIVYDKNGNALWERRIDHVAITGGFFGNNVVVATHGGNTYVFDENGNVKMKLHYGGDVAHNALWVVKDKYIATGGLHPTIFDFDGNILWSIEVKDIERRGFEGVNAIYLNDNASLLVLGYSNGKLEFWRKVDEKVEKASPEEHDHEPSQTPPLGTHPYYEQVYMARSKDGVHWVVNNTQIFDIFQMLIRLVYSNRYLVFR